MRFFFLIIASILLALAWFSYNTDEPVVNVEASSFEECVALGNPVMESYPRQCIDKAGNHFTELIEGVNQGSYVNATADDIITDIEAGAGISSPLSITGVARGYWFFEASFPVVLTDWDGKIIAEGYVTAEEEWMTIEFVPYKGELTFTKPEYGERGTLILKRDNPSDLRENDAALEIPVIFE